MNELNTVRKHFMRHMLEKTSFENLMCKSVSSPGSWGRGGKSFRGLDWRPDTFYVPYAADVRSIKEADKDFVTN